LPHLEDAIVFTLEIAVTPDRLNAIKGELTRTLPQIKSSHRCEAMSRGLGFRTHASAMASARSEAPDRVVVSGEPFVAYLTKHDFLVSAKPFYYAAAKVVLRDIAKMNPKLTMWGIGIGRPRRKADGKMEDLRDRDKKFVEAREELVSDGAVGAFLASLAFIARITRTKTIRSGTGSYRLKHIAESFACTYPEGYPLGPKYVPNGALIAAAIHAGFRFKTYVDELGYEDLNVSFNMSKPCIEELDCEIRPNGAHAQSRRFRTDMKRQYRYG
jgi:hypothetical protein